MGVKRRDMHVKDLFRCLRWHTLKSLINYLLVILCTAYGYMTRNVRSDFQETKYISFTMFIIVIVWSTGLFISSAVM